MTAGLTEKDFADVTVENAATTGQKLYAEYGITGVRGQVEAGLPAVLNIGQHRHQHHRPFEPGASTSPRRGAEGPSGRDALPGQGRAGGAG